MGQLIVNGITYQVVGDLERIKADFLAAIAAGKPGLMLDNRELSSSGSAVAAWVPTSALVEFPAS